MPSNPRPGKRSSSDSRPSSRRDARERDEARDDDKPPREHTGPGVWVRKSITVDRPPEEVYEFWKNFQNFPRFMHHIESVEVTGPGRSHWVANAPAGMTVEWDAEILEDRPNELIAWQSVQGATIANAGRVQFTPLPGGWTEVDIRLRYEPPGGRIAAALAKLFSEEPGQQVEEDLQRFKKVMELGEIPPPETRSPPPIPGEIKVPGQDIII